MRAVHGFSIVERRDGLRVNHYRNRPSNSIDVVKVRILALARDIRLKHLPERTFEVWDGIDAICKMIVKSDGSYHIKPYLLPASNLKEEAMLDRDRDLAKRNSRNNQRVGRVAGDMTSWIKAEPLDRVVCRMVEKSSFVGSVKCTSRRFEK